MLRATQTCDVYACAPARSARVVDSQRTRQARVGRTATPQTKMPITDANGDEIEVGQRVRENDFTYGPYM